jgi:putative endonuclease
MNCSEAEFWVYVLENRAGQFYIGSTDDPLRRLSQHNSREGAGRRFTAKHGPWRIVWAEGHLTRASAIHREREIKRMKSARWIRENLLELHAE